MAVYHAVQLCVVMCVEQAKHVSAPISRPNSKAPKCLCAVFVRLSCASPSSSCLHTLVVM